MFVSISESVRAQYDDSLVSMSIANINGDRINMVKMSGKDNHIKAKYFASKHNGNSISQEYVNWSKNRQIIAYTSGSYMNGCGPEKPESPGFLCVNGLIVNNKVDEKMDGLVIVNATGEVLAFNLNEGNVSVIESSTEREYILNLKDPMDFLFFKRWAYKEEVTVFQTHLLYYHDQPCVGSNGSAVERERRFLAVCKDEDDNVMHCLVNLPGNNTLYDATIKVTNYLKYDEDVKNIIFIVNLETGCQNVFQVFDEKSNRVLGSGFNGTADLSQASSLLVYYYE